MVGTMFDYAFNRPVLGAFSSKDIGACDEGQQPLPVIASTAQGGLAVVLLQWVVFPWYMPYCYTCWMELNLGIGLCG